MKTDRELLELAAKAAGYIVIEWLESCGDYYAEDFFGLVIRDGYKNEQRWNPLSDDGDALRLAMMLNISLKTQAAYPGNYEGSFSVVATNGTVENSSYGVCVSYSSPHCFVEKYIRDGEELAEWQKEFDKRPFDKMIATRRAIVRAAAAIGESIA